jgi:cation transport ATPase
MCLVSIPVEMKRMPEVRPVGVGTMYTQERIGKVFICLARSKELVPTMIVLRSAEPIAFIYNVLGVPIAAGILYPFFGLLLSPMIASAAMTGFASVISNTLRLNRLRL